MTDAVRTLKEWTDAARKIVFFGGAGVSTESGIPDFRSTGGENCPELPAKEEPRHLTGQMGMIK